MKSLKGDELSQRSWSHWEIYRIPTLIPGPCIPARGVNPGLVFLSSSSSSSSTGLNIGLNTVLNTGLNTGWNIVLNTVLNIVLNTGWNIGLNIGLNTGAKYRFKN